jgi:hypothetical protein
MKVSTRSIAAGGAIALATWTLAQAPPARGPTVEERIAALEAGVATLDTRLALAISRPTAEAGETAAGVVGRLTALENAVQRLSADVQRVERMVDNAARAANEAQRTAENAERVARDAAMRAR